MGGEAEKQRRAVQYLRHRLRRSRPYRPGPFGAVYALLLVGGLAGAATVYLGLVAWVPGSAANRTDTLKTALLVVAGSGAGAGLYLQYRKQRTDEASHVRDQDKLFTERYTAAVAQLGSASAAVRAGGVNALGRIADDSERDRATCLEMLCIYLRMPFDTDDGDPSERQVRTTAQRVLGERLRPEHMGFWSDAKVDLRGATLIDLQFDGIITNVALFHGVKFAGNTWFKGAVFGGESSFSDAVFAGQAAFDGCRFAAGVSFAKANFQDAWFRGAVFEGYATFDNTTFKENAWFKRASFNRGAYFHSASFLKQGRFPEATFKEVANFREATFAKGTTFDGSRFEGNAVFGKANFGRSPGFDAAAFHASAVFQEAIFEQPPSFTGARFHFQYPPQWPDGYNTPVDLGEPLD